ncbi:hypothetical protein Tco_0826404 [Tanacetum coccineum]
MTGNIAHISDFKDFDGGYVTFGGGAYGGRITSKGIQGVSESSTSSQQDQDNQDCIVMPIWKDASYFGDAAPRSVTDAQIQDKDGLHNENDAIEKSHDDSSLKDNGIAINTARPEINTGSREVSTASYFYVSLLILHQELTSPEQTATGKDFSNPLVINAPCFYNEALASPKQTAIGKDYSNPLMDGSLPKTILCVIL